MAVMIQPIGDKVLVRRAEAVTKIGSFIIPDSVQEKPQEAVVVSVGNGVRDSHGNIVPLEVKPGYTILLGKWHGTEVKVGDETLLMVKESDILGYFIKKVETTTK